MFRLPEDVVRKAASVVQQRTESGTDRASPAVWAAVKALSGTQAFRAGAGINGYSQKPSFWPGSSLNSSLIFENLNARTVLYKILRN